MQLGLLLALVAAIIISEHSPHAPLPTVTGRLLLILAIHAAIVLMALAVSLVAARAIRRDAAGRLTRLQRFAWAKQAHLLAWLAAVCVTFYGLGWPQMVRFNWRLDQVILVKDLVLLAPIWMTLLLSWGAFYEVERALYDAAVSVGTSGGDGPRPGIASRGQFVWLHARHYLGLCILPILLLLMFQDVLRAVAPAWEEADGAWLVYLVPLAAIMVAFPHMLSRIWSTSTLPESPLRTRLDGLTCRMGVRCRDFRIWKTDRQVFNAAVAGLLPSARYIFMTDALLLYLRDDELEAVIAHELGHVRRHHLMLRILLLGLPLWVAANFQTFAPQMTELATVWRSGFTGDPGVAGQLMTGCFTFALAVLALGSYSRLLEHDADLCVLDAGQAETFIATIDRLSYLCNDRRQRSTWLHPSTMARIHLLQRAVRDPQVAWSFRRRVALVNRLLFVAWILTPLAATIA
jgi:Zn-dependent protease with chaperone function